MKPHNLRPGHHNLYVSSVAKVTLGVKASLVKFFRGNRRAGSEDSPSQARCREPGAACGSTHSNSAETCRTCRGLAATLQRQGAVGEGRSTTIDMGSHLRGNVYKNLQDLEDRSNSAPPAMELTARSLFSFRPPDEGVHTRMRPLHESGENMSSTAEQRIIRDSVALTSSSSTTPGQSGNHAFLEAGSEISSIFGLGAQDFDLNDPELDAHVRDTSSSSVSAPVPLRARPPRAPGEPEYHGGLDVVHPQPQTPNPKP